MAAPEPINVALLGTGRIADLQLAPALAQVPALRLWSVLSRDRARGAAFAKKHGAAAPVPAHDGLAALLADPALQAVIIATPDKLHAEQVEACARAGKHVLCEKPLATDVVSCRRAVEACRAAKVRLGVAYHLRWHVGHRGIAKRIHSGELPAPRHARVHFTFKGDPTNWRASPEVGRWWPLAAAGTHGLDLLRWMMVPRCGEVVEVKSVLARPLLNGPHEESAVLALRFANGATAELMTSALFESTRRFELYGDGLEVVFLRTLHGTGDGELTVNGKPVSFPVQNPYAGELRDFAEAIRDGRDPEVPGEEGLRNVELLCQAAP